MITKTNANDRGPTDLGWLKSHHSFSFGHYYDPNKMGYSHLRVFNDDYVAPSKGFGTHPHDNMEIITYVLEGKLAHKDSMGNIETISPGEVQVMSAGSGLTHSEYNNSDSETVHLLQIWIQPNVSNTEPGYKQKIFNEKNKLQLVASPDARDGSLHIKQNASLFIGDYDVNNKMEYITQESRKYWVHIATGNVIINGHDASAGDSFAIENEQKIEIQTTAPSKFLLFELE